jgi:hypothetical protein
MKKYTLGGNMSANAKKWINRGGLISIVVGVVAYVATGGDAGTAGEIVTAAAGITGAVLVLIREILG